MPHLFSARQQRMVRIAVAASCWVYHQRSVLAYLGSREGGSSSRCIESEGGTESLEAAELFLQLSMTNYPIYSSVPHNKRREHRKNLRNILEKYIWESREYLNFFQRSSAVLWIGLRNGLW